MKDPDLAHIFTNAFPNTLDTTVMWHVDGVDTQAQKSMLQRDKGRWKGAQSFIVTGDINAEWLRDSTNQLAQYQLLAKSATEISNLLLGAINTQAEFVIQNPYCNAFQPPTPSRLKPTMTGFNDFVHPAYEPAVVFECKYELDSLASFLSLSNQYYNSTGSSQFVTQRWFQALKSLLEVLNQQSQPTFDPVTHEFLQNEYRFTRDTRTSTETLALNGIGNPLASGTGLVRSAFRPSDDATIFGFLIPSNAMMSVELSRTADMLTAIGGESQPVLDLAADLQARAARIRNGIFEHGTTNHPTYGKVFAYEVDGFSSHLLMDDANIPSLLALPLLGFVESSDDIYQNTRRMLLSPDHNPYYLSGKHFHGIGGPHVGLKNAWPMSLLVQAMTSDDDIEILDCIEAVKNVSIFGLVNESVNVEKGVRDGSGMTRSWFAWANSVFAQTILKIAAERPQLIFKDATKKYQLGNGFI